MINNNKILKIAIPSIVTNITVPLLGLIDVAIVGHLGSSAYIGAIAVGGLVFNIIYWVFAFLRMGTTGMASQAYGKRDLDESVRLLLRSAGTGLVISLILVALQYPILKVAFLLIKTTPEVQALASTYFHILIWGAPAVLGLYGFTGWYIGMQNSRFPMLIAIVQNVVNIVFSMCLVYLFHLKMEGVAIGTLIAQYAGLIIAVFLWVRFYKRLRRRIRIQGVWQRKAMLGFFAVNRDIFLRTICLVAVTMYFTSAGASQGNTVLAVNTLLMQFFILFSYFTDGFAYAGEALVGKYVGAKNRIALNKTIKELFAWGLGIALFFTCLYGFGEHFFIRFLTNEPEVIRVARDYSLWVCAIPLMSISAFVWDGVYIGATATRQMLLSMFLAAAVFFIAYISLRTAFGNHALWLAFILYLFSRGLFQTALAKSVLNKKCK
ncbi:MAG: GntR family transcriptional regulator [Bacteroidetes bacterium]|jgi:multidrug resistance protein, MATE family|nr:GntR family transcriptional regulator [Bacteroidota bacterium]